MRRPRASIKAGIYTDGRISACGVAHLIVLIRTAVNKLRHAFSRK